MAVISVALAVLLGIAAFPLVLVFGPVYFPWSLLVLACLGGVVGLSIAPHGLRSRVLYALGLAVLMIGVVVAVLMLTSNVAPNVRVLLSGWTASPFLSILIGVFAGASIRARNGVPRGAAIGAAAVFAVALVGAGLAFAAAPPDVAGAPTCDHGFDCPRTQCAIGAERRRFLAIERVTAFDADHITCTYTAWGGIYIGRADAGRRGGSWTDGAWPQFVSGRGG